jgi:hypothetical protein
MQSPTSNNGPLSTSCELAVKLSTAETAVDLAAWMTPE